MPLLRLSSARPLLRSGLGALALLFLLADDGIGNDEFQCEVAVVHLSDCCPNFPSSMLSCVHGGCDSQIVPDLPEDRSLCLQQKSCDELLQLGACDVSRWQPLASCTPPCAVQVPPCQ